jgi:hypothetical protein
VGATIIVCVTEEKKTAFNEPTVTSSDFHQAIVILKLFGRYAHGTAGLTL